jgi:hypothetical protein
VEIFIAVSLSPTEDSHFRVLGYDSRDEVSELLKLKQKRPHFAVKPFKSRA